MTYIKTPFPIGKMGKWENGKMGKWENGKMGKML